MEVAGESRASASSRAAVVSLPFSTNFARLFSMLPRARSSAVGAASISRTSNPACMNTCAMPFPMVPAPTTPMR